VTDRYVVLGLARPRAEWFRNVAQWSTTAALPAEFAKCVSLTELRTRLSSGRRHSAVLIDGGLPALDRDVIDDARDAGCAVFVVDDGIRAHSWPTMGAHVVLPPGFSREALLDALATHAVMVGQGTVEIVDGVLEDLSPRQLGSVALVCGPGGTGASTVAAALAQGLAASGDHGSVLLADLARHAEQAMLHDVGDIAPGVQELVEAHRTGLPSEDELDRMLFDITERRYRLLLGLRRARQWSTVRPRSFEAAFGALRRRFGVTVADVTADFEGEDDAGSLDLEDRNLMARTTARAADVAFVVGHQGVKGAHALIRVLGDVAAAGVPAARVVPVVNEASRHPKARAELAATIAELAPPSMGGGRPAPVLFLPNRKVEEAWRDGTPVPAPLPALLAKAYDAALRRLGPATGEVTAPVLVAPGALWGPRSDG
jgi:hypothetical protein